MAELDHLMPSMPRAELERICDFPDHSREPIEMSGF